MLIRIILLIGLAIGSKCTFSQNSFEILHSTQKNEVIVDLFEEDNGNFLAVGYEGRPGNSEDYKGLILRISSTGDTSVHKYYNNEKQFIFHNIQKSHDGNYFVFGSAFYIQDYSYDLLVVKLDTGLNLLWHKTYNFNEFTNYPMQVLPLANNEGFHLVSQYSNENWHQLTLLCRFDKNCDTVRSKLLHELGFGQDVRDAIFSKDSSCIYLVGNGFEYANGSRIKIGTNYNIRFKNKLPDNIYNNMTVKWYSDSTLLLAGCFPYFDIDNDPQDDDIIIFKLDTSFSEPINSSVFGTVDTIDYPAASGVLDFQNPDTIFLYGRHHVIFALWPQGINWISLYNLDSNLQARSANYFGGDAYYRPYTLLSTSDGGCLINAARYDYQTQDEEMDVLIMKLSKEDFLTSSDGTQIEQSIDGSVNISPNPGRDNIEIITEQANCDFKLFDLSGKLVIEKSSLPAITRINCSKLPKGVYLYFLTRNGRKIKGGKWIKQ